MIRYIVLYVLLALPVIAQGSVEISEIMYDVSGTDTKHEWVEIYNTGLESIDVTTLKLHEADVNHKISSFKGSATLAHGEYAVIADDATTFMVDYPSFNGNLFDSAYSLSSQGEKLTLKDSSLSELFSVVYDPSIGAQGDGNSLQKVGSLWKALAPTPGTEPIIDQVVSSDENTKSSGSVVAKPRRTQKEIELSEQRKLKDTIEVSINSQDTVTTYVGYVFEATGTNKSGTELKTGSYTWNMGDGTVFSGKSVMHTYRYPGTYIVHLYVSADGEEAQETKEIEVVDLDFSIEKNDTSLTLTNNTHIQIDISGWKVVSGTFTYIFPEYSYIKEGASLIVSSEYVLSESIFLYTRDNQLVATYNAPRYEMLAIDQEVVEEAIDESVIETEEVSVSEEIVEDVSHHDLVASVEASYNSLEDTGSKGHSVLLWVGILIALITIMGSIVYISRLDS